MKDLIEYNGSVDSDYKLHINNRKAFIADLKRFAGKSVEIVVKLKRSTRSSNQNRYYWGIVIPLVMQGLIELGHDVNKQETHEFIKANFNYEEIVNKDTGELFRMTQSTARLNKNDFGVMIEKLKVFASEYLNVYIPEPNEDLTLKM